MSTTSKILLTALIGIIAGVIDIIPMVKMKLDKYAITSAFVFYFLMPFMIFNTDLFRMTWWLKGGIITLALALPVIIIVSKDDRKSIPPMVVMSVLLGTLIGVTGHFFNLY
jgi:predicted permease